MNWYAARCGLSLRVAGQPSTEYFRAQEELLRAVQASDPGLVTSIVLNPVGWRLPDIGCGYTDYVGRAHGTAGVRALVRLQVNLRARGIAKPEAVNAALAGPIGKAHPDPFTGKPMQFDPSTGTLGFEVATKHLTGASRGLRERYGRMALRL